MAKEKPTFVDLNMINKNDVVTFSLVKFVTSLNFGGNANTMSPRSTQTSHVAVAVAVVES